MRWDVELLLTRDWHTAYFLRQLGRMEAAPHMPLQAAYIPRKHKMASHENLSLPAYRLPLYAARGMRRGTRCTLL